MDSSGISVPTPIFVDESCAILDTPYIVIDFIEGKTDFTPTDLAHFLHQYASTLAKIHQVEGGAETLWFLPSKDDLYTTRVDQYPASGTPEDKRQIWDILAAVCPLPQHNASTLLHGDFWPGNILWRDGQLVAVIDWEDAAIGDPLADVANSRLEILWALGIQAMHTFTHLYQSLTDTNLTNLPYWDLWVALGKPTDQFAGWAAGWIDFNRHDVTAQTLLSGYHWFISNALQQVFD